MAANPKLKTQNSKSSRSAARIASQAPSSLSVASMIEAILYLKGKPLPLAEIAEYAKCNKADAEEALIELMHDYAHRSSALEVVETPTGYCLQLRASFQELMQNLVPSELGVGALRTLAAIALKSPIAQTELVELRGSGAYQQVQELVQLGYVRKRRQSDGRSHWLQVTEKFHQHFELDQLPQQLEPQLSTDDDSSVASVLKDT